MLTTYLDLDRFRNMLISRKGDMTLRELADAISIVGSVSPSTLSRLENGKHFPDIETFLIICDWLGVPPVEFFGASIDGKEQETKLSLPEALTLLLHDYGVGSEIAKAIVTLVKTIVEK